MMIRITQLPIIKELSYAMPVLWFGSILMMLNMFFLKFSTDIILLSPVAVGSILGAARVWDAFFDPIVGYLSDHTRSKWGRRKVWIALSSLPLCLSFIATFAPPVGLSTISQNIWASIAVFTLYTSMSAFVIPHMSWASELGEKENRNRLFGIRHGMQTLGYIVGLGIITLILMSDGQDIARLHAYISSVTLTVFFMISIVICLIFTPKNTISVRTIDNNPFSTFYDVIKNPYAQPILFAAFVEFTALSITAVMGFYVAEYVINIKWLGPVSIIVWLVFSLIAIPIWVRIAKKIGKNKAWAVALLSNSLAYGSFFFLQEGSIVHMIIGCAIAGFGAGCGGAIGPSMLSDAVDYDEYHSNQRKEGAYFALWNLLIKAGSGITAMLAGFILQWVGFVPNIEASDSVKLTMLSYLSIAPLALYISGAFVIFRLEVSELERKSKIAKETILASK